MSRRKQAQNKAVAERAQQILAEKAQRKPRPTAAKAEGPEQPKRPKRERPPRKERKPRVHEDLLTIAFRGPLAGHFRALAERHQLSLAKLLQDALLSWETNVAAGYEPGTALSEWEARHGQEAETA